MGFKIRLLVTTLVVTSSINWVTASNVHADIPAVPLFTNFEACSSPADSDCIDTFQVASSESSALEDVTFLSASGQQPVHAWFEKFSGQNEKEFTLQLGACRGFNYSGCDLHEEPGKVYRFRIRLGSWNPNLEAITTMKVLNWQTEQENFGYDGEKIWVLDATFASTPRTVAAHCVSWDEPWQFEGTTANYCSAPQAQYDNSAQGFLHISAFGNSLWNEDVDAGIWTSSNATSWDWKLSDPTAPFSIQLRLAGPPTKLDGTPNYYFAKSFISDQVFRSYLGVEPSLINVDESFSITSSTDGTANTLPGTITRSSNNGRSGFIISLPAISSIATPTNTLNSLNEVQASGRPTNSTNIAIKVVRFKRISPSPSTLQKVKVQGRNIIFTVRVGKFADLVQPKCQSSSHTVYGNGKVKRNITTISLSKAIWKCKLRSVRRDGNRLLYSNWTSTKIFQIK